MSTQSITVDLSSLSSLFASDAYTGFDGLTLPAMSYWLSKASVQSLQDGLLYPVQHQYCGSQLASHAQLTSAGCQYAVLSGVFIQMATQGGYLLGHEGLSLDDVSKAQLLDDFAGVLESYALKPLAWMGPHLLLQKHTDCRVHSPHSLYSVVNSDLGSLFQTEGFGIDWMRLFTDLQMVLKTHPINQTRHAKGLKPIDAMWYWGDDSVLSSKVGVHKHLQISYDLIVGDNWYSHKTTLDFAKDLAISHQSILYADDKLFDACLYGNLQLLTEQLVLLEKRVLAPIIEAYRGKRLSSASIIVGNKDYRLGQWNHYYIHRPVKTWAQILRNHHGAKNT